MSNIRRRRQLPGDAEPVVTYSRIDIEKARAAAERAEPRFAGEPAAEWDAVEVPHVAPPLYARRAAVEVDDAAGLIDDDDVADSDVAKPRRRSSLFVVMLVAVVALALGVGILAYTFGSSTAVTVSAPATGEAAPAADAGPLDVTPGVRAIPLSGADGDGEATASAPSGPPAEPPAPRARPDRPASATASSGPAFDLAAPEPAPASPPDAAAAPAGGSDDAFIARIEKTLAKARSESSGPAPLPAAPLADGTLQPLTQPLPQPSLAQPQNPGPVPPEPIPDAEAQPLVLPDNLLLDTE